MIRTFKLYADSGKVWGAFLEYGSPTSPVTLDNVANALSAIEVTEYNRELVESTIKDNIYAIIEIADSPPENMAGVCWVMPRGDGIIMASVAPPRGNGSQITQFDVIEEIHQAGFDALLRNDDIIIRNLQAISKIPKFTTFQVAEPRSASFKVSLMHDRRSATATYMAPHGSDRISLDDAMEILKEARVVQGIDVDLLTQIVSSDNDVKDVIVASVKDAVQGQDGTIEYHFNAFGKGIGPRISEHDLADFRDLGIFESVEKDGVLAIRIPATTGEDGYDVTGQVIKAKKGKEIQLPKGKNTRVSEEDDNKLVANVAGTPKMYAGRVMVEEILAVNDIDFSTGNINFNGSVTINGIVNTGFSVTAGGDITCTDAIDGGSLYAGGSIYLKRGIKGLGKSVITAGKDIYAGFIERSTVTAGGSVIVDEALIRSITTAGDKVEVTGSKGSIFGGSVLAQNLIRANFLGSEMAIKTSLEVGAAPHLRERLSSLKATLAKKNFDYDRADKNLYILTTQKENGTLPPQREQMYETLSALTGQLLDEIGDIQMEISSLNADLMRAGEGRIEAVKTMYPGVVMTIKDSMRRVQEEISRAVFVHDGSDIVLSTEVAEANKADDKKTKESPKDEEEPISLKIPER